MGLSSNPAGSEANESNRFPNGRVPHRLLSNERTSERHSSESSVLRGGRNFRNTDFGRAGLVQQT